MGDNTLHRAISLRLHIFLGTYSFLSLIFIFSLHVVD